VEESSSFLSPNCASLAPPTCENSVQEAGILDVVPPTNGDVHVELVQSGDAKACARAAALHIAEIHFGLLPLLGPEFLARVYLSVAGAPAAGVWVARRDGRIVGFVAGCADVGALYKHMLRRDLLSLMGAAGVALGRPAVLRRLPSIALYPLRQRDATGERQAARSPAELLAIAVSDDSRGRGLGRLLVARFEEFLRALHVHEYHVATNIEEVDSNAFYRALGFRPVATIPHHALTLQLYEKALS
jgi:ribosomal protein S18 acetylase RimI-like enzyme